MYTYLIYYNQWHKSFRSGKVRNYRKFVTVNKKLNSKANIEKFDEITSGMSTYKIALLNAMEVEYDSTVEYIEI